MNKIEKLHLDAIEKNNWGQTEFEGLHTFENSKSFIEINAEIVASKTAEITKDVAIKFSEWKEGTMYDKEKGIDGKAIVRQYYPDYYGPLFDEFLKTLI